MSLLFFERVGCKSHRSSPREILGPAHATIGDRIGSDSMGHSTATTRLATIVGVWVRPNVSSSHRPLLLREHQVQVLNRSTGCAFAKIIENRGQQDVPVFRVRKYA